MLTILIIGAIIAFGVLIYNINYSDRGSVAEKQQRVDTGEKGCIWFVIFIGAIIIFAFAKTCTS